MASELHMNDDDPNLTNVLCDGCGEVISVGVKGVMLWWDTDDGRELCQSCMAKEGGGDGE